MSDNDLGDLGDSDDLLADDEPMPERRTTGRQQQQAEPTPHWRGPLITVLVAALSSLVTAAVVKSCGACVALGTWSPPYQSIEAAAVDKKVNADEHAAIRKELNDSMSAIHTEIVAGNTSIIKAIANQRERPARPR